MGGGLIYLRFFTAGFERDGLFELVQRIICTSVYVALVGEVHTYVG